MLIADLPPLRVEEFRLIRDFIRAHCGIHFHDDAKFLVHRRLAPRLAELGLADFAEYYRHLRFDPRRKAEIEQIVDAITTNETYFFREEYQLASFRDEILPELERLQPRGRRLLVWSAGCATGEEAYTVAVILRESGRFQGWDVRVFGTDISRRVLTVARRGLYGRSAFRSTEERFRRRYFREVDGKWQISDEIKSMVSFGQINLMDDDALALVGEAEVVFCRNVLIYFDQEARRRAIDAFHRKLVRRGYLLLGHAESLLNLSTAFELVHLSRDMVYRKP